MPTESLLSSVKDVAPAGSLWGGRRSGTSIEQAFLSDRKISIPAPPLSGPTFVADRIRNCNVDRRTTKVGSASTPSGEVGEFASANPPDPSHKSVLEQLDRLLQSRIFIQSDKLSRFLRFVVEHTTDGDPGCLKEYLIGVEVYDRKPPYDPSQDSIVRTEARRLRSKLKEYYEAEGKNDPVYIYLRPGSYVPVFHAKVDLIGGPDPTESSALLPNESSSILTAVLPFTDVSGNPISSSYARGISDELAYALMLTEGCTVISPYPTAFSGGYQGDTVTTVNTMRAQFAFEGSVRAAGSHLRVTARIVNASGTQIWVKRIDAEVAADVSFAVEEQIAVALSVGFHVAKRSRDGLQCAQTAIDTKGDALTHVL